MARSILFAFALAWLAAGVAGLALAAFGTDALEGMLPRLAIDTDALRAAIVAVAVGLLAVGVAHLVIVAGLRGRRRLAWTAGILLGGVMAATSLALGVASATSAVADPDRAPAYIAGALGALVAATGYALVTARLVGDVRSWTAR